MPPEHDPNLRQDQPAKEKQICRWVDQRTALRHFATYNGPTQSQQHIKPLHWYVACRLVLEGGFHPDDITPHPPFSVVHKKGENLLLFDPAKATGGERTILGGLKTKNVDVVVTKNGLGPVMAVSCKGAIGAMRNLTNRMEEAIGDCTNLHITYPAMVCGYLFVMRAHHESHLAAGGAEGGSSQRGRELQANDIVLQQDGSPVLSVRRFHSALRELTGRNGIRNDVSRNEAVSFALVETAGEEAGRIIGDFPPVDSRLRAERFFETLYRHYDERYVYSAPDLNNITRRLAWSPESPVFGPDKGGLGSGLEIDFEPRLTGGGEQLE
jgi:hypothetical protein